MWNLSAAKLDQVLRNNTLAKDKPSKHYHTEDFFEAIKIVSAFDK